MEKTKTWRKILAAALMVAIISLGLVGCKQEPESPSGANAASETAAKQAPTDETPTEEAPAEENPAGEHPAGEHPKE